MFRYNQLKKLGEGGFGAAYLVSSKEDSKKLYVIKEVKLGRDRKANEEAKKEAAFLRSLKHPNIVGYIESFMEGGGTGAPDYHNPKHTAIIESGGIPNYGGSGMNRLYIVMVCSQSRAFDLEACLYMT